MALRVPLFLPLAAGLASCGQLQALRDQVEGVTNRFVVAAVHVGVAGASDPDLADLLADTEFGQGANVTAFLADATEVGELSNAPITGVDVHFQAPSVGQLLMDEATNGKYVLDGEDGLDYDAGATVAIAATYGGKERRIPVLAPTAPTLSLAEQQVSGQPIAIDLRGQGYDSALVVVIRGSTGEMTFSNMPEGVNAFYELAHGESASVEVTVPGSAVAEEDVYALGVGGVYSADPEDFVEVNTALSSFVATSLRFVKICTFADPVFCDPPDDTGDWGDTGQAVE